MDFVNEELFAYIRSFLSFKEAHRARLVSKRWLSLDGVKLYLHIHNDTIPPPQAVFSSVNRLSIKILDSAAPKSLALIPYAICHIIFACSATLDTINLDIRQSVDFKFLLLNSITFPRLKKALIYTTKQIWRILQPKLHQVHTLCIRLTNTPGNVEIVDFSEFSNLITVYIIGHGYGSQYTLSKFPESIEQIIIGKIKAVGLLEKIISLVKGKQVVIKILQYHLCNIREWTLSALIEDGVCRITKALIPGEWMFAGEPMRNFVRTIKKMDNDMKFVIGKTVTNDCQVLELMKRSGEFKRDEYKSMIL